MNETILVTGAGGFIGGHLVGKLLQEGHRVRAVDKKPQSQWYQRFPAAENLTHEPPGEGRLYACGLWL